MTLFENEFPNGREGLVREITDKGFQKIIYSPNYGLLKAERMDSYMTNGVDIDSILYEYLKDNS